MTSDDVANGRRQLGTYVRNANIAAGLLAAGFIGSLFTRGLVQAILWGLCAGVSLYMLVLGLQVRGSARRGLAELARRLPRQPGGTASPALDTLQRIHSGVVRIGILVALAGALGAAFSPSHALFLIIVVAGTGVRLAVMGWVSRRKLQRYRQTMGHSRT